MIRATVAPLDQVVCSIGTTLATHMAEAFVAGDDRSSQLAPGLRAVGAVERVAALPLRWLPAARPVDWRLPWHGCLIETAAAPVKRSPQAKRGAMRGKKQMVKHKRNSPILVRLIACRCTCRQQKIVV